ncbi:MAG TPA: FtsH protease activity modulator HflK, partial [Desulfobacterales bacterium]|nr:FtsH protease activity modulator HflK [Desulfobacterales bacterium]
MSWDDQRPPWGQKRPPGPEEVIANLLRKIKEAFEGGGGGRQGGEPGGGSRGGGARNFGRIGIIVAVFVLANLVYNSFYTIEPGEKGVLLRFGRYVKTAEPGLNFMIPVIDRVIKVDVETVRKQEFGFRTKVP